MQLLLVLLFPKESPLALPPGEATPSHFVETKQRALNYTLSLTPSPFLADGPMESWNNARTLARSGGW